MTDDKNRVITVWAFAQALIKAGVMTEDEVNRTTHFVIDCNPNKGTVTMYSELVAETNLLDVVTTLQGIEISVVPKMQPLLSNDEILGIVQGYTDAQLTVNYNSELEKTGGWASPWAKLLAAEIESRYNPAVILKRNESMIRRNVGEDWHVEGE